jgi:hypothetical protein
MKCHILQPVSMDLKGVRAAGPSRKIVASVTDD